MIVDRVDLRRQAPHNVPNERRYGDTSWAFTSTVQASNQSLVAKVFPFVMATPGEGKMQGRLLDPQPIDIAKTVNGSADLFKRKGVARGIITYSGFRIAARHLHSCDLPTNP